MRDDMRQKLQRLATSGETQHLAKQVEELFRSAGFIG